jgi:pyruvate dehydrogenase E1 component alpha subunit
MPPTETFSTMPLPAPEHARHLYREMLRIRRFEERAAQLYQQEKIRGFLHLYIGEEAVCVGAMQALQPDDAFVGTYREHGHALIKGVSARSIMAEMYGKQEGCSRGRGGSMHLFDKATRFYGGNAIVGGGLPLAVGLGLAERMRKGSRIVACFFGEGAMAEGAFHESLNLAALWHLPVLFVCENNLYAMGTALSRSESEVDLVRHAETYRVRGRSVDGMDVVAVEAAARDAVAHVRSGEGPMFLEAKTYRFRAHSMFDAQLYREKTEVEEWRERDPIARFEARLRDAGLLDDGACGRIEGDVTEEIEDAVRFAEAGTFEAIAGLADHVYAGIVG